MTDTLPLKAITAALNQNWEEASEINQQILNENPQDVEALNRLGRALLELGKYSPAKKAFDEVLRIDPYNQIALKNLRNLTSRKNGTGNSHCILNPNLFLEEPGKTRTVSLVELAEKEIILGLSIGDEVKLVPKKRAINVTTQDGTYLGKLADDLSLRLSTFIDGGNIYAAHVKFTSPTEIKIFIREISRAKKYLYQPSFPPQEINYQAFIPPDLIHESRPDLPDAEGVEKSEGDDDESTSDEENNNSEEE